MRHDLKRPLNTGQDHSFLVPIDFSYATSYRLSIVTFALDAPFSHNTYVTDDRQTDATL